MLKIKGLDKNILSECLNVKLSVWLLMLIRVCHSEVEFRPCAQLVFNPRGIFRRERD